LERGAEEVYACCTHPVLSDDAAAKLDRSPIKQVVVTDTIPLAPEKRIEKIRVLSVAPLLADAIIRTHNEKSISELFDAYWSGQS